MMGVWIQLPSLEGTHFTTLVQSLGCTWSLTWLCQTNSHTFVSSLAVSDSIGCESATRIMERREQCILQSCLSLITLCFFSTPDVFIFAPFVKYLGNCLQLPSYMAFNCEIWGSFSLPLEKLFLQPLNVSSAICWKALHGWQTPFNASIPLSCQPFSWRALFHMSILFLSGRVSALLFNIKPWDFPVWRG